MSTNVNHTRTGVEARQWLAHHGVSVAQWAREHGVSRFLVYQVLNGRKKALRGQSHDIAVLLGMKNGKLRADLPPPDNKSPSNDSSIPPDLSYR